MPISILPFVVLRTPLLPYAAIQSLDLQQLEALCREPATQEAIFLASPTLYETMLAWLQGTATEGKKLEKLQLSLAKYVLRMGYRCTPFGLFAGITPLKECSIGFSLCEEMEGKAQTKVYATDVRAEARTTARHTRLDMDYLCALAHHLAQEPNIRAKLLYFPNNTLYAVGQQLRYAEYRVHKRSRNHFLVSVDNNEYVQQVLAAAQQGSKPDELAAVLVGEEISHEEALAFINEMIDAQVLVSELEAHITGQEYFERLLAKDLPIQPLFKEISQTLHSIDQQPLGTATPQYYAIAEKLKTLGVDFELGQLFQVDTLQERNLALAPELTEQLATSIGLLLATVPYQEHENLKKFKELLQQRYETEEVSLAQLLDNETGIGYPPKESHQADNAPLLDGIGVGGGGAASVRSYEWRAWQQFLLAKYTNFLQNNDTILHLTSQDLQTLTIQQAQQPPTSLYCFASLINQADQSQQIYLKGVNAPSAATLLGRFCHLDEGLTQAVQQALAAEAAANPDAVFAEIVHINQGRIGNISMRPQLRDYEIPIVVQANTDETHTILLSDLYVSLKGNRIFLRSKKLNKEVIPRLSSAHNFGLRSLPFYHFLCELQYQNHITGYHWSWSFLDNLDYLPRVVLDQTIILSRARWVIKTTELKPVVEAKEQEKIALLRAILHDKKMPRYLVFAEGDNELPIDTENEMAMQILLDGLQPQRNLLLVENLFPVERTSVRLSHTEVDSANVRAEARTTETDFTNEFIFPLQYVPKQENAKSVHFPSLEDLESVATDTENITRHFSIGSSWLYLKIYCGVKTADTILCEVIKPFAENLLATEKIDKWFFIRYADPQNHLRLRFYQTDGNFADLLQNLHHLLQPYLAANLITSLQTDTYKREIERYGAANMENSETLFCYDSIATTTILSHLATDDSGDQLRWQLALYGTDDLLNSFGLDLAAKKELMTKLQSNFYAEFGVRSKESKKMLSDKFRAERKNITALLSKTLHHTDELAIIWQTFEQRHQNFQPVVVQILSLDKQNKLGVALPDLLASYVHMFLNRFLRSKQRLHELVIYDFLVQFYTSEMARRK